MPNDECRISNDEFRMSNDEFEPRARNVLVGRNRQNRISTNEQTRSPYLHSTFDIRHLSLVIRHSSFAIRHSLVDLPVWLQRPAFIQNALEARAQNEIVRRLLVREHSQNRSLGVLQQMYRLRECQIPILIKNACGEVHKKSESSEFLSLLYDLLRRRAHTEDCNTAWPNPLPFVLRRLSHSLENLFHSCPARGAGDGGKAAGGAQRNPGYGMLSVVKNVEFCSLFFCSCPTNRDFEDHLETDFGIEDSENRLRSRSRPRPR